MDGNALVDETAAAIRARIMSGDIPIGAQLRQVELAKTLGVSRTPVREALRQLQTGGLIEVVPHRGAVVRVPAPWEVREAYDVRAELEGLACERVVARLTREVLAELRETNEPLRPGDAPPDGVSHAADDRFHALIHRVAGNERLARMIRQIDEAFPRNVAALVLRDDPRHRADTFAAHQRVHEALERGDGAAARHEMQAHVRDAGERLAHWYERRSTTVLRG